MHPPVLPALRAGFTEAWAEDACEAAGEGNVYFSPCLVLGNGTNVRRRRIYEPIFFTDYALRELRRLRAAEAAAPWMLVVSWRPPHEPYVAPRRHVEAIARRSKRSQAAGDARALPRAATLHAERERGYFAGVRAVDAEVGRLLSALDGDDGRAPPPATGARENLVVFVSDHGEMLGAHGQMGKTLSWDESARVPLLVRPPAVAAATKGASWSGAVSLADVAPTLLGFAGGRAHELCAKCGSRRGAASCADGRDLSAKLAKCAAGGPCGTAADRARRVRIGRAEGFAANRSSAWLGLVSEEIKLVLHGTGHVVGFNRTDDPSELAPWRSRGEHVAHARRELHDELGRARAQGEAARACGFGAQAPENGQAPKRSTRRGPERTR